MRPCAALVALGLCVVLASCGSAAASATYPTTCPISSASPNPALVSTALQAVRPYNAAAGWEVFSRCVSDATRVQTLYAAALALPHTSGFGSCPKGDGVEYELTFLHDTVVAHNMLLYADACLYLYISLSDIRWAGVGFQRQVAGVLGLTQLSPSYPLIGPETT